MAEQVLNTKIKLRYDEYSKWKSANPKLLRGEVALCYVPENEGDIKNTAPTVLFKVGDGEHLFDELQWGSGRAADVYNWAKASEKPTYDKGEVGLGNVLNVASYAKTETYSKTEIDGKLETITGALEKDTNTTYSFDMSVANQLTIYKRELGAESDTLVGTFKVDFSSITARLDAIDGESGQLASVKSRLDAIDGENGALATINSNKADKTELNNYYTKKEADGKFLTEHQDITGKADKTYVDEQLAGKVDSSTYTTDNATRTQRFEAVEGRVQTVEGKFSDYYTSAQIDAKGYAVASEVEADIKAVDNKFANYYTKAESDAFMTQDEVDSRIDAIIKSATDKESLDSLVELVEYIDTHSGDAVNMATAIQGIENQLNGISEGTGTVKKYVDDAISGLSIGDYATNERVKAVEDKVTVIEGKPAMNIVAEDITKWNAAEQNAKDYAKGYTDDEIEKVNGAAELLAGRVKTIEDDYLKAADKKEVNEAIAVEKGRVDTLVNTTIPRLDGRLQAIEGKPFDTYATKSEVEAVSGEVTKVDNRLKAVENDYLKSSDKTELSGLITAETQRADAAEKAVDKKVTDLAAIALTTINFSTFVLNCGGAEE